MRAVAGQTMSAAELADAKQEPLSEIGNIILTCCLSMMANMLKQSFERSLAEILQGNGAQLFEVSSPSEDSLCCFCTSIFGA